jgi:hypothetical protein
MQAAWTGHDNVNIPTPIGSYKRQRVDLKSETCSDERERVELKSEKLRSYERERVEQ